MMTDAAELRLFHRYDQCDGAAALAKAGQRTAGSATWPAPT